jgi:hypothetical protein
MYVHRIHLFVAIAMPRRSLIKPVNAYFTASVRKAASALASKLTAIYSENKEQNQKKKCDKKYNISIKQLVMDLQKWLHESAEFYWAIFHEDQGTKDVVEVSSTADTPVFIKKRKIFPLAG